VEHKVLGWMLLILGGKSRNFVAKNKKEKPFLKRLPLNKHSPNYIFENPRRIKPGGRFLVLIVQRKRKKHFDF